MGQDEKTRPGQVPWKEGEREALISDALAKGNVTQVAEGKGGQVQTTSPWRKRAASDKPAPEKT